jgi:nitroreductase
MRCCGLIGQTTLLPAQEFGYQSCPMDGFDYQAVTKIINLPENHGTALMIVTGKGIKDAWPKPGQLVPDEIMLTNSFS